MSFTGRLSRAWQHTTRAELVWLLFSVFLFWGGKWAGKMLQGIPGHAAAFWIPALFLARAAVPRPGAGTLTALLGGMLWSLPEPNPLGWAGYVAAGVTLDLLAPHTERLRWLPYALLGGVACSLAKFCFHNLPAAVVGVDAHFLSWGLMPVAGLHLLFGLVGGLIGWLLLRCFSPPRTGSC
jgi:hypothetical protein